MEPIIAHGLFTGVERLTRALTVLRDRCVNGIMANRGQCRAYVVRSIGIVTALAPVARLR